MTTNFDSAKPVHNTSVRLMNGEEMALPVSSGVPLFVVGPNGAGKSGLLLELYNTNSVNAVRVAAHRQTWMESNYVPFSTQQRPHHENSIKGQDHQPQARWTEFYASARIGIIIADLIDADNNLSRMVRDKVKIGDIPEAQKIVTNLSPLEIISNLFQESGIQLKLMVGQDGGILASKKGGPGYSIASLSDGERAALLIAGTILTARGGSLILIDEPERHLHASIVTPLLLKLFNERSDCAFVVSTHELGLPVNCPNATTVLIRDSATVDNKICQWDLDVLEPGIPIDDNTKEAIIGSRRKMLFIEGIATSLDKPLYEILFPGIAIYPRSSCGDVIHAVKSVRDAQELVWVQAYGIVDQDQLNHEKKMSLQEQGVFSLSVYSVEALYYHPIVVEVMSKRQCQIIGGEAAQMTALALSDLLKVISSEIDNLAARLTEQVVKDQISLKMPDWKKIKAGDGVAIAIDAPALYQAEREKLNAFVQANAVDKIIARYPIKVTRAPAAVAAALQFKSKDQYENAVRKLVADDTDIRDFLLGFFGGLPAALA